MYHRFLQDPSSEFYSPLLDRGPELPSQGPQAPSQASGSIHRVLESAHKGRIQGAQADAGCTPAPHVGPACGSVYSLNREKQWKGEGLGSSMT